jgi:hypothetical protein
MLQKRQGGNLEILNGPVDYWITPHGQQIDVCYYLKHHHSPNKLEHTRLITV